MLVSLSHIRPHLSCLTVSPAPLHCDAPKNLAWNIAAAMPLRSLLQTNWCETPPKRRGGNNNRQQQKQEWGGRWRAYLLSLYSRKPSVSADPPGCKLGVWVGGLNHKLAAEVQALSGALSLHSVSNHMSISSVVALCFNFSSPSTTVSSLSHLSLSPICSTWRQLIIYLFIYIRLKIGGAA